MSTLSNLMRNASTEAQGVLAQLGGAEQGATNFIGPDGRPYTGVFRSATAFESQSVGSEMEAHGFKDAEVMVLTMTKGQLTNVPLAWRRQYLNRVHPTRKCLIASITVTDRWLYSFVLIYKQGAA